MLPMNLKFNKYLYIIINIFLPIILGGFIYIVYRSEELMLFSWFNYFGLENFIDFFRKNIFLSSKVPFWFKYNLPDGLWVYSFTSFMLLIWRNEINGNNIFWFFLFPIVACVGEIFQFYKILPGTYDFLDILFYLILGYIPFLFFFKKMI